MHEELEAAHADAACGAVLVELHRTEIVAQEPAHVLKHAVCGLEKVDPREEVEDEVALHVVCLLEHVQLRVRLADRGEVVPPLRVSGHGLRGSATRETYQGKPATITSMSPGRGGEGSRELS